MKLSVKSRRKKGKEFIVKTQPFTGMGFGLILFWVWALSFGLIVNLAGQAHIQLKLWPDPTYLAQRTICDLDLDLNIKLNYIKQVGLRVETGLGRPRLTPEHS